MIQNRRLKPPDRTLLYISVSINSFLVLSAVSQHTHLKSDVDVGLVDSQPRVDASATVP